MTGDGSRLSLRLKQTLLVSAGAVVALIMVFLGLWQMQVFIDKGNRTVEDRAAQPPVALIEHVSASSQVGDVYGRRVTVSGHYLADHQLLIPGEGSSVRVLAAFEFADGRVVPIVRGLASDSSQVTPPPVGERTEMGLFLPGEGNVEGQAESSELASVRMPLLAQKWPDANLIPGFITLSAENAAAYGLAEGPVSLPQGDGSFQNGGYALQWWIFAAFAFGFTVIAAQGMGRRERKLREDAALAELESRKDENAGL